MFIKPIETHYNGYRFRSRLEARWAVFFDLMDIPYQYELQGYNLGGLCYLPDFWLPRLHLFVEIKGDTPSQVEIDKSERLCIGTKESSSIFVGDPFDPIEFYAFNWHGWDCEVSALLDFTPRSLIDRQAENIIHIDDQGFVKGFYKRQLVWTWVIDAWYPTFDRGITDVYDLPDGDYRTLRQSQLRARQARFEHGERPY